MERLTIRRSQLRKRSLPGWLHIESEPRVFAATPRQAHSVSLGDKFPRNDDRA